MQIESNMMWLLPVGVQIVTWHLFNSIAVSGNRAQHKIITTLLKMVLS